MTAASNTTVSLPPEDVVELAEMLEFIAEWFADSHDDPHRTTTPPHVRTVQRRRTRRRPATLRRPPDEDTMTATTTATSAAKVDEVIDLLRQLRLPHMRTHAPDVLATAKAQRWEPVETLEHSSPKNSPAAKPPRSAPG